MRGNFNPFFVFNQNPGGVPMKHNRTMLTLVLVAVVTLACSLPFLDGDTEASEQPPANNTDAGAPPDEAVSQPESPESPGEEIPTIAKPYAPNPIYEEPVDVPSAPTDLNVPLRVVNPVAAALAHEPVTSGVPFPSGSGIMDAQTLRLVDSSGNPLPAQFTPTARWGARVEDSAAELRWVLVDFFADLEGSETAYFFIQQGGPGPAPENPLLVVEKGSDVRIDTGAASFLVNTLDGSLEGPGMSAPLQGIITAENGSIYHSASPEQLEVTNYGTLRSVVSFNGSYSSEGGSLLDYSTQYWFYAGSPIVRVFHTIENNTPCPLEPDGQITCQDIGSDGSITFQDASLQMQADWGTNPVSFSIGGEGDPMSGGLEADLLLYQDSSGTNAWDKYLHMTDWDENPLDTQPRMQANVRFKGYMTTLGEQDIGSGNQAEGWLVLESNQSVWSAGVRDFWRQFPKALRVKQDGTIEIGLFPDEFGAEDYAFTLRPGEHKTHEVRIAPAFHPAISMPPLFAAAPPEWYVGSGEFGLTALPDWEDWPEHEQYLLYQLDTSPHDEGLEHVYDNILAAIEMTDFYGIFDYGDWPTDYEGFGVAPLGPKYDMGLGMWVQWARSGDMRWFWLAEAGGRHFADIDVLHTLHEPRHWSDGILFGHSYHDEEGFVNAHRNYGGAAPDTAFGAPGMLLTHYLTGYQNTYSATIELAECMEYRMHNDLYLCDYITSGTCSGEGWGLYPDGLYAAGARPASNALNILVTAYRATSDERYLSTADSLVAWAAAENQPYINGPPGGGDEEDHMRPWMLNLYLRALTNYLEMRSQYGMEDTYGAIGSYVRYADWLHEYAWIDLEAVDGSGPRAAYPYKWFFNERQGDINDEWSEGNNIPSINNWLYLGADAQAYAYHLTEDTLYLERAATLFRTGAMDPFFPGDPSLYTETKQTINSIVFGNTFLHIWEGARE
jgi:hypothetical protein